ncbi:hypothetical protein RB213_001168 [Colletotrichum asianum]
MIALIPTSSFIHPIAALHASYFAKSTILSPSALSFPRSGHARLRPGC